MYRITLELDVQDYTRARCKGLPVELDVQNYTRAICTGLPVELDAHVLDKSLIYWQT